MRALIYAGLNQILSRTKQTDIPPALRFGLLFRGWKDKDFEPESKQKRDALEEVCELGTYSIRLLDELRTRQMYLASSTVSRQGIVFDREALSQAPFVTGMGLEHPLENGFSFLHPYGLPYLPGSSVKGVVRRAAEELTLFEPDPKGWDIVKVWWLFGFDSTSAFFPQPDGKAPHPVVQEEKKHWLESYRASLDRCDPKLAKALVSALPKKEECDKWIAKPIEFLRKLPEADMKSVRQSLHIRGALRFWDVYPKPPENRLRVDIMNPHYNHYYQGDKAQGKKILPPGDWGTPNPIYFLTVPAGTSFRFVVEYEPVPKPELRGLLPTDSVKALLDQAMHFAFSWLGFGAKTSIGYGLMAPQAGAVKGTQTRDASEARPAESTHISSLSGAHPSETGESHPKPPSPPRATWKAVTLTWNPGEKELSCTHQQNKAFVRGKDLVPPSLAPKLEKKKPFKVDIEVEHIGGNKYKIVKITEPS